MHGLKCLSSDLFIDLAPVIFRIHVVKLSSFVIMLPLSLQKSGNRECQQAQCLGSLTSWLLHLQDLHGVPQSKISALLQDKCSSVMYMEHLYCLVVQAGFYGNVVACLLHMRWVVGSILS